MPILPGRRVRTTILLIAAGVAGIACGSVSYDGGDTLNPCPTCPSSYPDLVFELRNTTTAEAYLLTGNETSASCSTGCRVLAGGSRMTGQYDGLTIGNAVGVTAEVGGGIVATVDCVVTRTEATPLRAVVFSGPPYQLTCQNW